jgi:hypothetical protein
MSTIYLVMGESGAYSDWRQWPVRAFQMKAAAAAHAAAATAWSKEREEEFLRRQQAIGPRPKYSFPLSSAYEAWNERFRPIEAWYSSQHNPHDPDGDPHEGTTYSVWPVLFAEA